VNWRVGKRKDKPIAMMHRQLMISDLCNAQTFRMQHSCNPRVWHGVLCIAKLLIHCQNK
jgi:hypothetical protein